MGEEREIGMEAGRLVWGERIFICYCKLSGKKMSTQLICVGYITSRVGWGDCVLIDVLIAFLADMKPVSV